MLDRKEINNILTFSVTIPTDYSLNGFKMRNPDNFYKIDERIIDRHFKCSHKFFSGEMLKANIIELQGRWELKECLDLIKEKDGLFPNAIGLTLAFEQGERLLISRLNKPLNKSKKRPSIIGLDISDVTWWTGLNNYVGVPKLQSEEEAFSAEIKWSFKLTSDNYFGGSEDCLLYFTKPEPTKN